MALCRDTSTQVEQIVTGNRRASSLYVALTMRRGRIRWPRTIKDFCESSPFRLWPNYLPDIAAMEKIRNRICHSHDHIHRRFFSLFPFIDDQRRGLFDSNGMLLCKLVFCAKNARFFPPPGEMSRNLISVALLRRNSGGKGRGMILSMVKGVRTPVRREATSLSRIPIRRVSSCVHIGKDSILRDLRLGSAF